MNKNIDLGTFNWDISKIEKQLIENRQQMEGFSAALALNKKALNEEKKEIQELGVKIAAMKEIQKIANQQVKDGTISQEEYKKTIQDSNKVIIESEIRTKDLASAQASNIKMILESERSIKELRLESNELNKLLSAGRTEIKGNEGAYSELNKELNASKIEAKNLGAEVIKLRRAGKENTDEYRELVKVWKATSAQANSLNDDFKEVDKAVGDNHRSVADYTDSIKKAFSDVPDMIMSGDIKGALSTLKGGIGEIFNLVKANPILLVFSGVALFVKEMYEYNDSIKENLIYTENLFSRAGEKSQEYLDKVRNNITGIAETFNLEFKEVANVVDDLVDTGAVKDELEALEIIKQNIVKAPDANGFLQALGDTAIIAEQTGMKIQDVISAKMSLDASGGNNAFFDAMAKGTKSLLEGSDKLVKTMSSSLGAAFTNDILSKVEKGTLTVVDALESIRKKGEEVGISEGERMKLAIQLFGKSSVAAGGYSKIMDTVAESIKKSEEPLTDLQKHSLDLITINQELAIAKDDAFKSDAVLAFQKNFEIVWKKVQIYFYKVIDEITEFLGDAINGMRLGFMNVRDFIKIIPQAFSTVMKGVIGDFNQLASIAQSVGSVISAAFTFDPNIGGVIDNLLNKVKSFKSQTGASISEVAKLGSDINTKNVGTINAQNAESAAARKAEIEAEAKAAEEAKNKIAGSGNSKVKGLEKAKAEKFKEIENAAKKELEVAQKLADEKTKIAQYELAKYIEDNTAKLKEEKRLNEQMLADKQAYYEEVERLKLAEINSQEAKDLLGKTLDEQEQIRKDYALKRQALERETDEKVAEDKKAFDEQVAEDKNLSQAIEFQQKLIDLETQGASEYEIRTEQALQQRDEDLAVLEQQRLDDAISLENYEAQKILIESRYAQTSKQIEEDKQKAVLSGYGNLFGNISQLLGQNTEAGKAAAIAEATITGYQSALQAYNTALKSPISIVNPAYPFIQAGISAAFSIAQIAKIASTPTGKKAARGMLITGNSHENGGVPVNTPGGVIEAEGGEPILTKKSFQMFPELISAINVAGGGIPLYASGGITPSRTATVQSSIRINPGPAVLSDESVLAIASAIYSGSQAGIGDMADNRKIANGANF